MDIQVSGIVAITACLQHWESHNYDQSYQYTQQSN